MNDIFDDRDNSILIKDPAFQLRVKKEKKDLEILFLILLLPDRDRTSSKCSNISVAEFYVNLYQIFSIINAIE